MYFDEIHDESLRDILNHYWGVPYEAMDQLGLTKEAEALIQERRRQVEKEGWTPEHDDEHRRGELACAAACYAEAAGRRHPKALPLTAWPWDIGFWKPSTPTRMLEKAGALILAELERLRRLESKES